MYITVYRDVVEWRGKKSEKEISTKCVKMFLLNFLCYQEFLRNLNSLNHGNQNIKIRKAGISHQGINHSMISRSRVSLDDQRGEEKTNKV